MGPWRWSVQPGGSRWHRGVVVEVCMEGGETLALAACVVGRPRAGRPAVTLSVAMGDPVLGRPAMCDPVLWWPAMCDPVRGGHP